MRTTSNTTLARSQPNTISPDSLILMILLMGFHVGLALWFRSVRMIATIHAFVVLVLGVWTAITAKDLRKVIPYAAYVSGAEILWRMTTANIAWEFGKYTVVLFFVLALITQNKPIKNFRLSIFYFLLFLPSIYLTLEAFGLSSLSRGLISFNLSGPLSTAVCIVFFSQIEMDQLDLRNAVLAMVYPIIGVLTLAIHSTVTATAIYFGSESVFVTSGGYGPNQVSAVLGLAAMLLILYPVMIPKVKGRGIFIMLALVLISQSFLTFSRGGLYNTGFALGLAFLVLLRKPTKIMRPFLILFLIIVVVGFVVFPRLESLTGGALSERFSDFDPINRLALAKMDVDLFLTHPIAGVGVGMSSYLRGGVVGTASHTEYSRILADHGALGILAFVILAGMLIRAFLQAPNPVAQAWIVACAAWSAVEMAHSAMRIVAVSLVLGLAFITFKPAEEPPPDESVVSYRFYKFRKLKKARDGS